MDNNLPQDYQILNMPQQYAPSPVSGWGADNEGIIKDILDVKELLEEVKCWLMSVEKDEENNKYVPIKIYNHKLKKNVDMPPMMNQTGLRNVFASIIGACNKFQSLADFSPYEANRKCETFAARIAIDIGINMNEWEINPNNYEAICDTLDDLYQTAVKKAVNALTIKKIFENVNVNVNKAEGEHMQKPNYWGRLFK